MTDQQHHQTKLPTETPVSHGRDEKGSGLTGHSPHGGHDKYEGHSVGMFRDRFSLPLVLTVPVVYFSETVQGWLGYPAPTFPGSEWVSPVLGTIIFFYGGASFLRGAVREAREGQPGMMLLIGMAITVAFVVSRRRGWPDSDQRAWIGDVSASTVIVAVSAQFLRRLQLRQA